MKKLIIITFIFILTLLKVSGQWVNLLSGVPNLIVSDITQTPSGNLFAVGTKISGTTYIPQIFRSLNNGASWDTILVPPTGYFFQTIAFLNNTIGYIGVGGGAYILQTTDGGNSWNYYYQNPLGTSINDIEVIDSADAVACGFGQNMYLSGAAYKLTNQYNWSLDSQSFATVTLDDLQMLNQDTGYALSLFNKKLFETTDGGNSWDSIYDFPTVVEKMYWWSVDTGIAVGFNAYYYKTTDGGFNWSVDSIAGYTTELTGVAFFDSFNGYACGARGKLFNSNDGGATWHHETDFTTGDFYNLEIHGGSAYAVGANGTIVRHENSLGIDPVEKENELKLFPNPSDDDVQISSEYPIESVSVSDLAGRSVLFDTGVNSKKYSINIIDLPNGIYFLQTTGRKNKSVHKLIVNH